MHTRDIRRWDLRLSRFARFVNANTVAYIIIRVGLVEAIAFGVLLVKLIIVWHATDKESDSSNAEHEEMEWQLSEWPRFGDEQLIWKIVCDAKPLDE